MIATTFSSQVQTYIARRGFCNADRKKKSRGTLHASTGSRFFVLLLFILVSLLTACSSDPSAILTTPTLAHSTPKPTTQPTSMVFYQSDWSHGLTGWHASSGWKDVGDYLQTDLGDERSLTMPHSPTVPNYAVEFHLQVVNVPKDGGYFMLTADPTSGKDGYQAHILNLLDPGHHGFAIHPLSEVVIDPSQDQMYDASAQTFDYEPGSQWRTYRVEVRGKQVQFFIDGIRVSRASSMKSGTLSNGPIRLVCGKAVLRVNNFRITSL